MEAVVPAGGDGGAVKGSGGGGGGGGGRAGGGGGELGEELAVKEGVLALAVVAVPNGSQAEENAAADHHDELQREVVHVARAHVRKQRPRSAPHCTQVH